MKKRQETKSIDDEQAMMLGYMCRAIEIIEGCWEFAFLIPEVRSNLVYAKMGARDSNDVVGIDGRITVMNGMPHASGHPRFGASSHMARIIIALHKHDPKIRSGLNLSFFPELEKSLREFCRKKKIKIVEISRTNEPDKVKGAREGSMSWKAREAVRLAQGKVPDVFFEHGDIGKEPITTFVGKNPVEVAERACEFARFREI